MGTDGSGLQHDDGNLPVGAHLVLLVGRVASDKLGPEPLPFLSDGLYGAHPSSGLTDLHRCIWVLLEVEPPSGMAILQGVRGDDYEPVAVLAWPLLEEP
jgi:hypothetical protein